MVSFNINYSQCITVPANSPSSNVTYNYSGGSFQSYGCAPIDPTYWMSGSGNSITATYSTPQDYPKFRVWGMNSDDVASVMVNGIPYPLNSGTAGFEPKVVCGLSPGPDGVAFINGSLAGANTPEAGNYSYSDIQIKTTGVNTIQVTGLSGAGWGFAGTVINCPLANENFDWNKEITIYGSKNLLNVVVSNDFIGATISIFDVQGNAVRKFTLSELRTVQTLQNGLYIIKIEKNNALFTKKILLL